MKMQFTRIACATLLILGSEQVLFSFATAADDGAANTTAVAPVEPAATDTKASTPTATPAERAPSQQPMVRAAPPDFLSQTIVTVNGEPITGLMFRTYLADRMQKIPNAQPSPQLHNLVINELINVVLLNQVAKARHIDTRPEIAVALDLQRSQLLSGQVLQDQSTASPPPSDEALQQIYKERYSTPAQEYKAAHILVKTEDEAKEIISQLGQGKDFAALAKEKSLDSTAQQGGDLGWFESGQMVKPFTDALATLKPGTITTTPVQTQFGWHVIKLEEQRSQPSPTFETVRPSLLVEEQRKVLTKYVEQLRSQAKIEVNQEFTRPAEAATPK